ncbi:acylphosphatase [Agromyces italicus]|uniref:acylphosphatase n=1 Tax=Agromyces italicus TaxID=279572 RepID=UPI0003B720CF|nr:acylphosphatase [Agromyces italicus]
MRVVRRNVVVRGRVQGVGFRFETRAAAKRLHVSGWVRNREDGTVEAEIEGHEASVAAMLDWLHDGPPGAHVVGVDLTEIEPIGVPGFTVR